MIALGDMPFISPKTFDVVISKFNTAAEGAIIVPLFDGRRGHPIIFAARYFDDLSRLSGDMGARTIIDRNLDRVEKIVVDDHAILRDIDHPGDLIEK